jgi:GntR family transcriptional regulator of vanillate catabolism
MDQLSRVLLALREDIATGKLSPGERVVEEEISARFGVSRTPVRPALRLLEAEGLLEPAGARGFRVRQVDADCIRMAILARGALEGLAAREIALKGLSANHLDVLRACLVKGDELLQGDSVTEEQAVEYNRLNITFHATILEAAQSEVIAMLLAKCANMPFAGTHYIAYDRTNPRGEHRRFQFAHAQHHIIVAAILDRDCARSELMMREHANNALHYVELFRSRGFRQPQIAVLSGEGRMPGPDRGGRSALATDLKPDGSDTPRLQGRKRASLVRARIQ